MSTDMRVKGPAIGRGPRGAAVLLLAGAAAAVGVQVSLDRHRPPAVRLAEFSLLPRGEYLRVMVLGYRELVADLIWLKVVQQLGDREQTVEGYRAAARAVDVLTDLDPKFAFAYQATGAILTVWAKLPQESVALLAKGMAENPDVWQLPFYLGYNYYFELHDPARAALYFRKAALLPGAPAYLPKLAARMTVEAGEPAAAIEFLRRLLQQTQDERLKEGLMERLREVVAERDIRLLERAVRDYRDRRGAMPERLDDLVSAGLLRRLPTEPWGGEYRLNRADGSVQSSGLGRRLRVHRPEP